MSVPKESEITRTTFPAAELHSDWQTLCEKIGERRAGTELERRAAEFVRMRFQDAGVKAVQIEEFPCNSLRAATVDVHEKNPTGWQRVEATTLVGAPATPGAGAVAGELVWLELPENASRIRADTLRGRIVAIFGPLPTSVAIH